MTTPPDARARPVRFTERSVLYFAAGTRQRIADLAAAEDPPTSYPDWVRRALARALASAERRREAAPRSRRKR